MAKDRYYNTAKHIKWSKAVLRKAKYLCEECIRYGRKTKATHAHHIEPRKERPDIQYLVSNGKALCGGCHNKIEPRR